MSSMLLPPLFWLICPICQAPVLKFGLHPGPPDVRTHLRQHFNRLQLVSFVGTRIIRCHFGGLQMTGILRIILGWCRHIQWMPCYHVKGIFHGSLSIPVCCSRSSGSPMPVTVLTNTLSYRAMMWRRKKILLLQQLTAIMPLYYAVSIQTVHL